MEDSCLSPGFARALRGACLIPIDETSVDEILEQPAPSAAERNPGVLSDGAVVARVEELEKPLLGDVWHQGTAVAESDEVVPEDRALSDGVDTRFGYSHGRESIPCRRRRRSAPPAVVCKVGWVNRKPFSSAGRPRVARIGGGAAPVAAKMRPRPRGTRLLRARPRRFRPG